MITIVDHIDGGKVFLDTETFMYYRMPVIEQKKMFVNGDKESPFYDSFYEFVNSKDQSAVIPVFCGGFKHIKKRTQAELITFKDNLKFFNVEKINNKWIKNDIKSCLVNRGYLAFVNKNIDALNDLTIRKVGMIGRNSDFNRQLG